MRALLKVLASLALLLGLSASLSTPALAAGWWVTVPPSSAPISALASNRETTTLAISRGYAGWYDPLSGSYRRAPGLGRARLVAASGDRGLVLLSSGQLRYLPSSGKSRPVRGALGRVEAIGLGAGSQPLMVVASSKGLFQGRAGAALHREVSGRATALASPPLPRLDWFAIVSGRLWRLQGGGWRLQPHSPSFAGDTSALAELADGLLMVAEPSGEIWSGPPEDLFPAFQLLPQGGLAGVPRITSMVADSTSAAYVGTDGFATLLSPDGGYSWYRSGPSPGRVTGMATLGPVFAARPSGYVVAVTPGGVFLHRLQELPAPPVYAPTRQQEELWLTAAVTVLAAALVVGGLLLGSRKRRRFA